MVVTYTFYDALWVSGVTDVSDASGSHRRVSTEPAVKRLGSRFHRASPSCGLKGFHLQPGEFLEKKHHQFHIVVEKTEGFG